MKKTTVPEEYLLNLNIDILLKICSLVLHDDFVAFTNLFQVFFVYMNEEEVSNLLHHLDWTYMHVHRISWNPIVSVRLTQFLKRCTEIRVSHALSYNACNNLFLKNQILENMFLLQNLETCDHFSFLAINFFRTFYNPQAFEESAKVVHLMFINNKKFNAHLSHFTQALNGRLKLCQGGWGARQIMKPSFSTCPMYKERPAHHYSPYGWPAHMERVRLSNCNHCFLLMLFEIIFD